MPRTKKSTPAQADALRSTLGKKQVRGKKLSLLPSVSAEEDVVRHEESTSDDEGDEKVVSTPIAPTPASTEVEVETVVKEKKPRRHRPGVLAMRAVRSLCRADTTCFQKAPFRRLVKDIISDRTSNPDEVRLSKRGLALLQNGIEQLVCRDWRQALRIATTCGNLRVSAKHLLLVREITQPLDMELTTTLQNKLYESRDLGLAAEVAARKRQEYKKRKLATAAAAAAMVTDAPLQAEEEEDEEAEEFPVAEGADDEAYMRRISEEMS